MKLTLKNVRLSFPHLFQKASFNGNETKFEATFLLNKETQADQIKALKAAIADKLKNDLKGAKIAADKICLRDGDDVSYDGYANQMSIKASNVKRPVIIDRDKSQLTEDDNRIYAGCYVNAIIELWAQDNQYGKRINANLLGVQFAKDGDAFGDGAVSVSADDFDAIDDEDEIAF